MQLRATMIEKGIKKSTDSEDSDDNLQSFVPDRYQLSKSSASCDFSDINSIVFGGFASRFWIYRKHINRMDGNHKFMKNSIERVPFYAWECLTLVLKNRTVDLVVKNEADMMRLLKVLVYSIDTVDGTLGSATRLRSVYEKEQNVLGNFINPVKRR